MNSQQFVWYHFAFDSCFQQLPILFLDFVVLCSGIETGPYYSSTSFQFVQVHVSLLQSFVNSSDKTGFVHLNLDQVLRVKVEWKRRWNGGRMGEGNLDGSKRMELGRGNTMALKTILVIFLTLSLLKHMSASKLGNCCMSQPACRIFVVFI